MKYLSLFTGIGGFELGIQQADELLRNAHGGQKRRSKANQKAAQGQGLFSTQGKDTRAKKRSARAGTSNDANQGPLCVGYSEIDKSAIAIYQRHYPEQKNYGDIRKIKPKKLPDFDLLVGGFPCQSFSIAGKRLGFKDTRGTLFFDIARIIKIKRPRLLLLENVKGLLSHDEGRTFSVIIRTLDELGYDIQWQVLNSKDFGVPQNRERIFIVGHLRGTPRPEIFPFTENNSEDIILPTITTRITADSNGTYVGKKSPQVGTYRTHKDGQGFRRSKSGLVPTIPARAREDGSGQPVILQKSQDWREKRKLRRFEKISPTIRANMGDNHPMILASRGRNSTNSKTMEQRFEANKNGTTNTLTSVQKDNLLLNQTKIRRLTPKECERLQGFPDDWTASVSDTQRYKTLGNAVTVNVVRKIALHLLLGK
jgi:DNA (cytosine-5)-methyltransferase 1